MAKWIKKLLMQGLRRLPATLRNEVVRRSIQIPDNLPENLVFKIAETTDELEAAFRLVYDSYLPLGYCEPNDYRLRSTVHHALASTTTLLALDQGQVVGTLSVIRDNRLGLPLEKVFNVNCLRKNSDRIAEITSMVIDKNYRREKGGQVLFPLLRLMYEYSTSYFGVRHLVVSIHPKDAFFYESLLLFKKIPGTTVQDYLGAPAVTLHLDLQFALHEYEKIYAKRNTKSNLFYFFVQRKIPNVKMPSRQFQKINDPLVTREYYQKLFIEKLGLQIEDRRRSINYNLADEMTNPSMRFEVEMKIYSHSHSQLIKSESLGRVRDISQTGFRAYFEIFINLDNEIEFTIEVGPKIFSKVTAHAVWQSIDYGVGFAIVKSDSNWVDLVQFLKIEQTHIAA